jgi:CRP/FNR family cyclic AMP-dependent transcriptional regulator
MAGSASTENVSEPNGSGRAMTGHSQCYLALLPHAHQRYFRRSQILFEHGTDGDTAFLVVNGQVELFVDYWRRRTLISRKRPGAVFGEFALLGDGTRITSAVTTEDSRIGIVQRSDFDRCLENNPDLRSVFLRDQVRLIGQLTVRISTAQLDAYSRLRFGLLDMACDGDDGLEIPGRLTQGDLAAHAGCTRETAAKIIAALKRGGWLRFESNRVVILKPLPESF